MSSLAATLGTSFDSHPLRRAFLKWQCRVRQLAMRDLQGRPNEAAMPDVILPGQTEPLGTVITILNKQPAHSVTPEMLHMARRTRDRLYVRSQAIQFLSATYYQKAAEFSDILTATFPPGSPGAAQIREAGRCRLVFDAYAQRFDLDCKVWQLAEHNSLHEATMAHNRLFNPDLPAETVVLGFEPEWAASASDPNLT